MAGFWHLCRGGRHTASSSEIGQAGVGLVAAMVTRLRVSRINSDLTLALAEARTASTR
jgi:hypothetical protein